QPAITGTRGRPVRAPAGHLLDLGRACDLGAVQRCSRGPATVRPCDGPDARSRRTVRVPGPDAERHGCAYRRAAAGRVRPGGVARGLGAVRPGAAADPVRLTVTKFGGRVREPGRPSSRSCRSCYEQAKTKLRCIQSEEVAVALDPPA